MFQEHQVVKLKRDMPAASLRAGTVGAVVMVYLETPQAYEVEFVDSEGNTLALLTLQENELIEAGYKPYS